MISCYRELLRVRKLKNSWRLHDEEAEVRGRPTSRSFIWCKIRGNDFPKKNSQQTFIIVCLYFHLAPCTNFKITPLGHFRLALHIILSVKRSITVFCWIRSTVYFPYYVPYRIFACDFHFRTSWRGF
jgi:hypothetical protein